VRFARATLRWNVSGHAASLRCRSPRIRCVGRTRTRLCRSRRGRQRSCESRIGERLGHSETVSRSSRPATGVAGTCATACWSLAEAIERSRTHWSSRKERSKYTSNTS
jgi:hypothetical protein